VFIINDFIIAELIAIKKGDIHSKQASAQRDNRKQKSGRKKYEAPVWCSCRKRALTKWRVVFAHMNSSSAEIADLNTRSLCTTLLYCVCSVDKNNYIIIKNGYM